MLKLTADQFKQLVRLYFFEKLYLFLLQRSKKTNLRERLGQTEAYDPLWERLLSQVFIYLTRILQNSFKQAELAAASANGGK